MHTCTRTRRYERLQLSARTYPAPKKVGMNLTVLGADGTRTTYNLNEEAVGDGSVESIPAKIHTSRYDESVAPWGSSDPCMSMGEQ